MSTVSTKYSPLRINFTVGQPYGNVSGGYSCGFHTGVDIPESGTGQKNPELYSITDSGTVVYTYKDSTGSTPTLGNQVQILDNRTGLYFRYCHMVHGSINVNVGDTVDLSTYIGKMGTTGNSSGTHLHLEASTTQNWSCSTFTNPCNPLGFPNIRGTVVEYDGDAPTPDPPTPDPPTPERTSRKNNWAKRSLNGKTIRLT